LHAARVQVRLDLLERQRVAGARQQVVGGPCVEEDEVVGLGRMVGREPSPSRPLSATMSAIFTAPLILATMARTASSCSGLAPLACPARAPIRLGIAPYRKWGWS
jgi:hypothetical protein